MSTRTRGDGRPGRKLPSLPLLAAGGGILVTLTAVLLIGLFLVGSEHVSLGAATRGEDLMASTRRFLAGKGIIEPDEDVRWFYSRGLFGVHDNGNLITDRRAIVYRRLDDGTLEVRSVDYPSMVRIYANFNDAYLEDVTGVRIDVGDGSQLFLAMGDGDAGDPEALEELRRLRESAR